MAQNPDKAWEVSNGVIIDESSGIFSGVNSPVGLINTSKGSIYLRTNGEIWKKQNDTINDWELLPRSVSVIEIVNSNTSINSLTNLVRVQTSSGSINITLPVISSLPTHREITIKDIDNNARLNQVTIIPGVGDTIDNDTDVVVRIDRFSLTLKATSANNWEII